MVKMVTAPLRRFIPNQGMQILRNGKEEDLIETNADVVKW